MKIPEEMQGTYKEIPEILTEYSREYLNEEYEELCLHVLEKLCRKRPSPLKNGKKNTWAAGIVYAIGSNNFIFDKHQAIHTTMKELASAFGISPSTVSGKGALIKKALKTDYFNAEWCLPSQTGSNPMLWIVEIDGLPVDARMLPVEMQRICHERGLIPYVYADKKFPE